MRILWVVSSYGRSIYYYPWVLRLACRMAQGHDVYMLFLGSPSGFDCDRVHISWVPSEVSSPYSRAPFRTGHLFLSMLGDVDVAVLNLPDTGFVMSLVPVSREMREAWDKVYVLWHRAVKPTLLGIEKKAHAKVLAKVRGVISPYPGLVPPGGSVVFGGLPVLDYPYVGESFAIVLPTGLKLWDPFPYGAFIRAKMGIPVFGTPGEWSEVWEELMSVRLMGLNKAVRWYEKIFATE